VQANLWFDEQKPHQAKSWG